MNKNNLKEYLLTLLEDKSEEEVAAALTSALNEISVEKELARKNALQKKEDLRNIITALNDYLEKYYDIKGPENSISDEDITRLMEDFDSFMPSIKSFMDAFMSTPDTKEFSFTFSTPKEKKGTCGCTHDVCKMVNTPEYFKNPILDFLQDNNLL